MKNEATIMLKRNTTNKFIDIDQNSGGYPYDVDSFLRAATFTPERAISYMGVFKSSYEFTPYKVVFKNEYQVELQEVKVLQENKIEYKLDI